MSKQSLQHISDIALEELTSSVDSGIRWRADCERRRSEFFGLLFSWGSIERQIKIRTEYIISILPQLMRASALGVSLSGPKSIYDLDGAICTEIEKLRSRADTLEHLLMEIRNG